MKYSLALIFLPCKILRKNKQQEEEEENANAILREPNKGQIALLQEKIFKSGFSPKHSRGILKVYMPPFMYTCS